MNGVILHLSYATVLNAAETSVGEFTVIAQNYIKNLMQIVKLENPLKAW